VRLEDFLADARAGEAGGGARRVASARPAHGATR
jgi:hypothetical protein